MNADMVVPKAMLVYKLHFCSEIRIIRAYIIGKLISTFKICKPVFMTSLIKVLILCLLLGGNCLYLALKCAVTETSTDPLAMHQSHQR